MKYTTPKNLKVIQNDEGWGSLAGPKFMKRLRKMYKVSNHSHMNGLMSCSICVFLLFKYEDDLEKLASKK